jgi:ABC-type phosphate/phosphonate transport system substrate-binding protein
MGDGPIAALPMYDFPDLRLQTDALWTAIAQRLSAMEIADVPSGLTRGRDHFDIWRDPDLLIGQACEYPLATGLAGDIKLIATPRYTAEGCLGATYKSAIVVRRQEPVDSLAGMFGRRCVINEPSSNSGMNLLRAAIAPIAGGKPFFESVTVSGSHRQSAEMVAGAEADLTAIDCVTFAHLQRFQPDITDRLRVIGWTQSSPSLPFITSARSSEATIATMRAALAEVMEDNDLAEIRDALLIDGFDFAPDETFTDVLNIASYAVDRGYPLLA